LKYTINSKPIGDHQSLSIEFPKKPVPPDGWQFVAGADLLGSTIEIERYKRIDKDCFSPLPYSHEPIKPWWKFWQR